MHGYIIAALAISALGAACLHVSRSAKNTRSLSEGEGPARAERLAQTRWSLAGLTSGRPDQGRL